MRTIEINESALLMRVVEVTGIEAVFPDFSWVTAGKNCSIAARSFADQEDAFKEDNSFTVYLGLKKWERFEAHVSRVSSSDEIKNTRYNSLEEPAKLEDLYDQGPPAQIHFMMHNLKIFWQSEKDKAGDYHLMPILRFRMSGDIIRQDKTFVPPALTLDSCDVLPQVVKNVREQMQARCRVPETYYSDHDQGS